MQQPHIQNYSSHKAQNILIAQGEKAHKIFQNLTNPPRKTLKTQAITIVRNPMHSKLH